MGLNLAFWKKKDDAPKTSKRLRPRELPQDVGRHIIVNMNEDPDWVWGLRCVMKPVAGQETDFDIRIFNPAEAGSVAGGIKDYDTLDAHPDVVMFNGRYSKGTGKVQLVKRS